MELRESTECAPRPLGLVQPLQRHDHRPVHPSRGDGRHHGPAVGLVTLLAAAPVSELDRVAPSYQFHEVHRTTVRATPDRAYRAIKEVTASEILFFRELTWLRRLGRPGRRTS